ncbi:hypothetical protein PT276_02755 [Orbaceae bacterium ESL0721]|nr:hypothetical protein [Orbaceae bacterium ESL0721]
MNHLDELRKAQSNLITIEDTLYFLQKRYNCSLSDAAEMLLYALEKKCDKQDDNRYFNPSFFGKKTGIATFLHVDSNPNIYSLLKDIIANRSCAFEIELDFDDDIPF